MREMLVPCLIGTVAVVFMFQANTLIYLGKTFATSNIPVLAAAQYIFFKTPDFLRQTLPIGMALASSLAISRLTRESELTAMRAAGMPIRRIIYPVGLFGLIVGGLNFWITEGVQPTSEKKANELGQKIYISGNAADYRQNVTLKLKRGTAFFGSVDTDQGRRRIRDAVVYDQPRPGKVTLSFAEEGYFDNGILVFPNTEMYQLERGKLVGYICKKMTIDETQSLNDLFVMEQPSGQSLSELKGLIVSKRNLGQDVSAIQMEYYSRFAIPASCIVFAIAGPVFAVRVGRHGGFVGVFLSCVMVMIYYNMYVVSTLILGRNGWVSPMVAAWLPNAIFLAFGIIGLRRTE